ncbi:hypothetical protein [Actinomadura sp. GTD37]|uniref:hypothetical protein n=1 Tax=Actinomadura sp. GTD37 TaxID=1778030 RepID=UPI0035C15AEC
MIHPLHTLTCAARRRRSRRRIGRAVRQLQGTPYRWGSGTRMEFSDPPPSHADPNIVGNAEGNHRLRDRDCAAIRARLQEEHDMGERDR